VCDRCVGSSVRSEQRSPKASRFALTRSPLNLNPNLLAPPRSPPSPRTIMSEHASFDWLGLHRVARPRCCDRTGPAAGGGQHVPDRRGVRGAARGRSGRCDAQGSISHPGRSVAQNKTSTHTKSMLAESQRCALCAIAISLPTEASVPVASRPRLTRGAALSPLPRRKTVSRLAADWAGVLRLCGLGLADLSEDERCLLARLPPNPLDAIISALGMADGGCEALSVCPHHRSNNSRAPLTPAAHARARLAHAEA
jgi:hypothetical protein